MWDATRAAIAETRMSVNTLIAEAAEQSEEHRTWLETFGTEAGM